MNNKTIIGAAVVGAIAITGAFMAMANSDGMEGMDHSNMEMSETEMVEEAVHADATINTISETIINVSHGPIPELSWPAMTMDFAIAPDAQGIEDFKAGDAVNMMLIKGEDGMYMIMGLAAQ